MHKLKSILYGNIYDENSEFIDYGGPRCYAEMSLAFRQQVILLSTVCNILFMCKLQPTIKRSTELSSALGRLPNIVEKIVGYLSWATFITQIFYKFYTQRGLYVLNPCHIVVLVQAFLLLNPKTVNSAYVFVCYTRWLFGVYAVITHIYLEALLFPDLEGLDLIFEPHLFFVEHWMGVIGPIVLIASGRYGFVDWRTLLHHQLFGFATQILYHRLILAPISILTMTNLNFNLCRAKDDPWIALVGTQWYYLFSEYYLEISSLMGFTLSIGLGKSIRSILTPVLYKLKNS